MIETLAFIGDKGRTNFDDEALRFLNNRSHEVLRKYEEKN
jgi:hypothetical protein